MANAHDECLRGDEPDERLALPIEQGVRLWCMPMWVVEMKRGSGRRSESKKCSPSWAPSLRCPA